MIPIIDISMFSQQFLLTIAHNIQKKDKNFYFSINTIKNDIDNWYKGEQIVVVKRTKVIKELFERERC